MKSGMIYSEMMALISQIKSKSDQITDLLDTFKAEVVPQLERSYSGKAATAFNDVLTKESFKIKRYMEEICENQLKKEAIKQKQAYEQQDARLQIQ